MQTKFKNGYITIYFVLCFMIIIPFIWAMIEGVATGTARVRSQMVADLGLDSIFAEYHREIFRQYGLFFIDDSYGTENGSVKKTEDRLAEYMSYNTGEKKEAKLQAYYSFEKLRNIYLEIEEVSFATDNKGKVWKAQAIQYMKDHYGIGYLDIVKNQLQTVNENSLCSRNIDAEIMQKRQEIEMAVKQKEIVEKQAVEKAREEKEISYETIMDAMDEWKGQGVLVYVLPEQIGISSMSFHKEECVSSRYKNMECNEGSGLPEYEKGVDDLDQELLFNEYLLEKYGNYRREKENSYLSYELEYILSGHDNDQSNLRDCAEKLLLMREASNFLYLNTRDPMKKKEVEGICTIICSFCAVPELSEALTQVVLGIWAYGESVIDVKTLFDGGKVPLIKEKGDWKLSLSGIFHTGSWRSYNISQIEKKGALNYEGYLRILLGLMNSDEKTMRSLDIVELDIRKTAGNENFRIDQCIDRALISFGFQDSYQHEFVFTREWRYE